MENKNGILILKGLLLGYADMTIINAPDKKNEYWHQQAYRIKKFLNGKKKVPLSKVNSKLVNKKFEQCKELDCTYFDNKHFSSYICMISILDYLINEKNDLELKSRFGTWDISKIRTELETNDDFKDVTFDSNKYITQLLKIIGE